MRHGKPVEGQKDVLDSRVSLHLRVVNGHNEVGMVGQPTNPEVNQEHPKHHGGFLFLLNRSFHLLCQDAHGSLAPKIMGVPNVDENHSNQGNEVG